MKAEHVARMQKHLTDNALPLLTNCEIDETAVVQWQHYDGKDPVKGIIYRGTSSQYENVWKFECVLEGITAPNMWHYLAAQDSDCWVPFVYQSEMHTKGPNWSIVQQIASGLLSISDREMLVIRFNGDNFFIDGVEHFYQIWCSIDDELYPNINPKSVRGKVYPGGIIMKPCDYDNNSCSFTYVHNVDLKGHFPKWLTGLCAYKFLQHFAQAIKNEASKAKKHY